MRSTCKDIFNAVHECNYWTDESTEGYAHPVINRSHCIDANSHSFCFENYLRFSKKYAPGNTEIMVIAPKLMEAKTVMD